MLRAASFHIRGQVADDGSPISSGITAEVSSRPSWPLFGHEVADGSLAVMRSGVRERLAAGAG